MPVFNTLARTLARHDLDNIGQRKSVVVHNAVSAVLSGVSALPVPILPQVAGVANMTYGVVKLLSGGFYCLSKALLGSWVQGHMSEGVRQMKSGVVSTLLGVVTLIPALGQLANANALARSLSGAALLFQVTNGAAAIKDAADAGAAVLAPETITTARPGS